MKKPKPEFHDPLPINIAATSADEALAELRRRGYADPAARKYAKAARSWTERGSSEWAVWEEVERRTGEKR